MIRRLVQLISRLVRHRAPASERALDLGRRVVDGEIMHTRVTVPQARRTEHLAVLGKTGSGKSYLLRYLAKQDIEAGRGFAYFDLHGDATAFLVSTIAAREAIGKEDLSERFILVQPADPEGSVGLNPLESESENDRFVQIAEFAEVLRERWNLDSFGARTDELLRNSLYTLSENRLTLLELDPLLAHAGFRAACLKNVRNPEIRRYFILRYDQASEPMRATMREPILNKTSAFTTDRRFRHIVGQQSTFSVLEAMDRNAWIILDLHKGRLGEQGMTLASAFFTLIKNRLFSRKERGLFTLYCDEVQNLVPYAGGLDTVLSESRKFAISVTSANQFMDQYPPGMRAAIMALGTQVFFQLSSIDASQIAPAIGGGRPLSELLKNLPRRHMVVKTGHEPWCEAVVPKLNEPTVDTSELLARSRSRWARPRAEIEEEIGRRQRLAATADHVLDDWE